MKLILHSLLLAFSFLFVFIWTQTLLVSYTIQLLGILIFFYILASFIRRKFVKNLPAFGTTSDIFILNTAILLTIAITGNLYSPLFFLLYFLGFGITFIFEPATILVFALGTIIIFLPEALKNGSIESFIRIGSLVLISPLAFFFGQDYKDREKQEEEIEAIQERSLDAANVISKDVEEVIKTEKTSLKPNDMEKLNEILEETEELREEAKIGK